MVLIFKGTLTSLNGRINVICVSCWVDLSTGTSDTPSWQSTQWGVRGQKCGDLSGWATWAVLPRVWKQRGITLSGQKTHMEIFQKHVKLWLHKAACALSCGSSYPTDYVFCPHLQITAMKNCSLLGPLSYSVARAEIRAGWASGIL